MRYSQKLLDPRWQKKRLSIFERDGWKCRSCGSKEGTLHLHHAFYEHGAEPWDYPDYAFLTLCSDCHASEHEEMPDAILNLRHQMAASGIVTSADITYLQFIISTKFVDGEFNG